MAYSNGNITAPVSIYDIQQATVNSSSDLGYLIVNGRINKWAKYKPVPLNRVDTTDELNNDNTWKGTDEIDHPWWQGKSPYRCGLSYLSYSSLSNCKTAIDNKTIVWSYVRPSGTALEVFRQIDFNHYHKDALPPTYALGASAAQMKAGSKLVIQVATSTDDGFCLKFSDVGAFNSYYYTAAVYDSSGNLKFLLSATKAIGQYGDGESIEIEVPYSDANIGGYSGILTQGQTYKAYVFISSHNYSTVTTSAAGGSNTYIPLPCGEGDYGMQPVSFMAKADSQWAIIDAFCPLNGVIVNWTVDLYGAGAPSSTTLRLINLDGTPVSGTGTSTTINFSTGATAITAGDGTTGWRKSSTPQTSLTLPTNNPELYMVEFVYSNITARAMIGHDLNPNS